VCSACQTPLGLLEGMAGAQRPPSNNLGTLPTRGPGSGNVAVLPGTPPAMSAAAPAGAATMKLKLVVVRGQVGPGSSFKLTGNACPAGRTKGLLLFPNDAFVAPLHATFFYRDSRLFIKDENAPSGTFVSVTKELIQPGTFFAVGDTLLRYQGPLPTPAPTPVLHYGAPLPPNPMYMVEEVLEGLRPGRCLARSGPTLAVGQSGCELLVVDALVAPRHCELTFNPQGATLRDLNSPTGTFVRIPPGSERALEAGDQVRLGNEVLRVEAV
jgi:pSer/pThr/pTyr-binding forkhead associated (FHA) protein